MAARIVIVGAGLAGLAAATRLRALGAEILLVERAERAGGRASSDVREGFVFDAGAQLAGARDEHLAALVAAAGLAASHLPLRPVAPAVVRRGEVVPVDLGNLRGIARIPGLGWPAALRLARLERLRTRFAGILTPQSPTRGARLDDRSAADFARIYLGRRVLARLVDPHLGDFQADPAETSRLLWLLALEQRHRTTEGTLRGALGELCDALAAPLEVELGVHAVALAPRGRHLELAVDGPDRERVLEADAVMMATPALAALRVARPLLAPAEQDVLAAARRVPAIVLHLALEVPAARHALRVRVPSAEGGPIAALQLEPAAGSGRAPEGPGRVSLIARARLSRAHLEAPDDVIEKTLVAAFERLLPAKRGAVRFSLLRRFAGAWPRFPVGRFRALARLERVAADRRAQGRRVYLAGDHLSLPTLEGAARSGLLAAEAVAEDLGLERKLRS